MSLPVREPDLAGVAQISAAGAVHSASRPAFKDGLQTLRCAVADAGDRGNARGGIGAFRRVGLSARRRRVRPETKKPPGLSQGALVAEPIGSTLTLHLPKTIQRSG